LPKHEIPSFPPAFVFVRQLDHDTSDAKILRPRAAIMTKLKRELFIWAILTVTALVVGYILYKRGLVTAGLRF
jgi:hypothetical protein